MGRLTASHNSIERHFAVPTENLKSLHLSQWLLRASGASCVVDRLGVTECRRRVFHMSPAVLLWGIPFIPHDDLWFIIFNTLVVVVSVSILFLAVILSPLLTRKGEKHWMYAVFGYMIPVVLPLLIFPDRAEFGLMTLQILALGDGSATLGGLVIGGRRLPWNPRKTVSGFLCFTIVGTFAATYSYWGEAHIGGAVGTAFVICAVAAISAAIVESLPIQSNDNLRVGATSLFVGITMTALLL